MTNFPVNKEVRKIIEDMASSLPAVPTGKKVPMYKEYYGSTIIDGIKKEKPNLKRPYTIKEGGKDVIIDPNKKYHVMVSPFELYNHINELEKAWKTGGHPTCLNYIHRIKNLAAQPKKKEAKPEIEYGEANVSFDKDGNMI